MQASLRALLTGVIDYAGLFPPAKLPLEAAFANYVRYHDSTDNWLLGRFICPATELPHLAATAVPFSILGRGGPDCATFFSNLAQDLALIEDFLRRSPRAAIEGFEVRLPTSLMSNREELRSFLQQFLTFQTPFTSFEAGFHGDWRTSLGSLLRVLKEIDPPGARCGFKLRCGGLEAAAFPPPEQVAFVLNECARRTIRLKFTAGLHHPFHHFDAALATPMHGFINVFAAGVLAAAPAIDESELCKILADEEPRHFHFADDAFRWQHWSVTVDEITRARRDFVASFGSCSFEEPLDDLRKLGLK